MRLGAKCIPAPLPGRSPLPGDCDATQLLLGVEPSSKAHEVDTARDLESEGLTRPVQKLSRHAIMACTWMPGPRNCDLSQLQMGVKPAFTGTETGLHNGLELRRDNPRPGSRPGIPSTCSSRRFQVRQVLLDAVRTVSDPLTVFPSPGHWDVGGSAEILGGDSRPSE